MRIDCSDNMRGENKTEVQKKPQNGFVRLQVLVRMGHSLNRRMHIYAEEMETLLTIIMFGKRSRKNTLALIIADET